MLADGSRVRVWICGAGRQDIMICPADDCPLGISLYGGRVVSHIATSAVKVGAECCAVGDALVGIVVCTLLQLGLRLKQF